MTSNRKNTSSSPAYKKYSTREIMEITELRRKKEEAARKDALAKALEKSEVKVGVMKKLEVKPTVKIEEKKEEKIVEKIEQELGVGATLLGFGPTSREKYWKKPLF